MKTHAIAVAALSVCLVAPTVHASLWTSVSPNPPDLYDLDHTRYYTWGLSTTEDLSAIEVTAARLVFSGIYDWTAEPNALYVHLLNSLPDGVRTYTDNQGGGDNFAGQGVLLTTLVNLPTSPQTLIYNFTAAQVAAFDAFLHDGNNVGLGFDPDCRFFNSGVRLEVEYVPEPACASVIAVGGVLMALRPRRR